MTQALFGTHRLLVEVSEILATQVFEFAAFEEIPHVFLRIEVRSIARQPLEMHPFPYWTGEKGFDHIRAMDWRAIPNNEQLA